MPDTNITPEIAQNMNPVREADTTTGAAQGPREGIALCLSGGGYRAMVFHLGALWRLNQLGFLKKLSRVSSVSGGSITAGVLGLAWKKLQFDANDVAGNFDQLVTQPIRKLAAITIDRGAILEGSLLPFATIADEIVKDYKKYLFGNATLQDLPADNEGPRFVINSTNVQTRALWRFSKPFMGDYRVGLIRNPTISLAVAVGASSAFPPFLSPTELKLNPADFDPTTNGGLQYEPYTSNVVLTDGGVYDNLGLETAWKNYKTILVSNGGGVPTNEPKPAHDWARHTYRILDLLYDQVGSLRIRQVIGSYEAKLRQGTYWGIGTDIKNYQLPNALNCPHDETMVLANTPTRLASMDAELQEQLINWGFAVCDAAMRKHVDNSLPAPSGFPYPEAGV